MISDADAVRWAVRVMPQLAAKADGRPDELGQQYLDRLTALADRLETHALVPKQATPKMLEAAIGWRERDSREGLTGEADMFDRAYHAMLTASEAK